MGECQKPKRMILNLSRNGKISSVQAAICHMCTINFEISQQQSWSPYTNMLKLYVGEYKKGDLH